MSSIPTPDSYEFRLKIRTNFGGTVFPAHNSAREQIEALQSEEGGNNGWLRLPMPNSGRRRLAKPTKIDHRTRLTDQERAKTMVVWTLPARGAAGGPTPERRRSWWWWIPGGVTLRTITGNCTSQPAHRTGPLSRAALGLDGSSFHRGMKDVSDRRTVTRGTKPEGKNLCQNKAALNQRVPRSKPSQKRWRGWCRRRPAGPARPAATGRYEYWATHHNNFTGGATLALQKCNCWRCMKIPDGCSKVVGGSVRGCSVPAETDNDNTCHSIKKQVAQSFLSGRVGEITNKGCSAPNYRRAPSSFNSPAAQFSERDFWGIRVPLKKTVVELKPKDKNRGWSQRDGEQPAAAGAGSAVGPRLCERWLYLYQLLGGGATSQAEREDADQGERDGEGRCREHERGGQHFRGLRMLKSYNAWRTVLKQNKKDKLKKKSVEWYKIEQKLDGSVIVQAKTLHCRIFLCSGQFLDSKETKRPNMRVGGWVSEPTGRPSGRSRAGAACTTLEPGRPAPCWHVAWHREETQIRVKVAHETHSAELASGGARQSPCIQRKSRLAPD